MCPEETYRESPYADFIIEGTYIHAVGVAPAHEAQQACAAKACASRHRTCSGALGPRSCGAAADRVWLRWTLRRSRSTRSASGNSGMYVHQHLRRQLNGMQAVRKGKVNEVETMITRLGIDVNLRCHNRRGTLVFIDAK